MTTRENSTTEAEFVEISLGIINRGQGLQYHGVFPAGLWEL